MELWGKAPFMQTGFCSWWNCWLLPQPQEKHLKASCTAASTTANPWHLLQGGAQALGQVLGALTAGSVDSWDGGMERRKILLNGLKPHCQQENHGKPCRRKPVCAPPHRGDWSSHGKKQWGLVVLNIKKGRVEGHRKLRLVQISSWSLTRP